MFVAVTFNLKIIDILEPKIQLVQIKMLFVKRKKRPEISSPTNFEHRVHSGFDHDQGIFVGLPTQWNSIISETGQQKNVNLPGTLSKIQMNNVGHRPKSIIDPSRITPNELTCFKVNKNEYSILAKS